MKMVMSRLWNRLLDENLDKLLQIAIEGPELVMILKNCLIVLKKLAVE